MNTNNCNIPSLGTGMENVSSDNVLSSLKQGSEASDNIPQKLLQEVNVWASQLKMFMKPKVAIFAIVDNNQLKKMELVFIINHLKKIGVYDQAVEVHYLPSPQFILVGFENEESLLKFKELSFFIENKQTIFISGNESRASCNIFINSLPIDVTQAIVLPLLERWGRVVKISPTTMPRKNGLKINVGQIKIQFEFNKDSNIESIPYFIRVYGCKVYLHIPGKNKICFRCGDIDHMVQQCSKAYCPLCKGIKVKSHICALSYAQATKVSPHGSNDTLLGVLEDKDLSHLDSLSGECNVANIASGSVKGDEVDKETVLKSVLDDSGEQPMNGNINSKIFTIPVKSGLEGEQRASSGDISISSEGTYYSDSETQSAEPVVFDNEIKVKLRSSSSKRKRQSRIKKLNGKKPIEADAKNAVGKRNFKSHGKKKKQDLQSIDSLSESNNMPVVSDMKDVSIIEIEKLNN